MKERPSGTELEVSNDRSRPLFDSLREAAGQGDYEERVQKLLSELPHDYLTALLEDALYRLATLPDDEGGDGLAHALGASRGQALIIVIDEEEAPTFDRETALAYANALHEEHQYKETELGEFIRQLSEYLKSKIGSMSEGDRDALTTFLEEIESDKRTKNRRLREIKNLIQYNEVFGDSDAKSSLNMLLAHLSPVEMNQKRKKRALTRLS